MERLGYVGISPDTQPFDAVFNGRPGGEQNDGNIIGFNGIFQSFAHFNAIHFRHHDVTDHQIIVIFGDFIKSVKSINGFIHVNA